MWPRVDWQARLGHLSKLKNLLAYGACVNAADYDARACLHLAASEGNLPIVKYLITEGRADVNCVDRWGGAHARAAPQVPRIARIGGTLVASAVLRGH